MGLSSLGYVLRYGRFFFSSRALELKDSLEWDPWLVGRGIKNPFRAPLPKMQEKLQRDKAGQDWNSWIVLSVVFWAEQEGVERPVMELECIFVLPENEQQVKAVMGWDDHEGWSLPWMNVRAFECSGGEKILHLSLSGTAFWALWLLLACPSADTRNNGLLLIRGFSCCQTPRILCLPLLFTWTPCLGSDRSLLALSKS